MHRTRIFLLVLCCLVLHCASAPRQIFLVVVVDTMRRDALGCYGNPDGVTPTMDAIAEEGVRYDNAVTTTGWTLPSIASLMTGTWPTIHGARGKGATLTAIRDEVPTAAEVFRDQGFATLGIGNATFVSPLLGLDRGFEIYDHMHARNYEIRRADETTDLLLAYLEGQDADDRFAFVHFFDPHLDYDPPLDPAPFVGGRSDPPPPLTVETCLGLRREEGPPSESDIDYIRGTYHAEIHFVDRQIGRIVDWLRAKGLYDRTTLVILSDHGEEFWDHGDFEHGHTLYEELVRIPLIVKPAAGVISGGQVIDRQVRVLDVMPTLFSLAGIPSPRSFRGEPLPGFDAAGTDEVRVAYGENPLYGAERVSWRTDRYTLIYTLGADPRQGLELYDRSTDPHETTNVAAARPEVARELYEQVSAFAQRLNAESATMSRPQPMDMSPQAIEALKGLGYIR